MEITIFRFYPGKHSAPFLGQLWLSLGVELMEINSNLFSRMLNLKGSRQSPTYLKNVS